ncbi:thermonuclease family protein [Rhizobium sp. WYJ-E13]|uniref:thermonuclease family protein n=1 Tax=Rhizobium sp. WYJ-E13 TaxID=2849093 RepID=UPI001C1EB399|nr:thermonuclease family protein [Rhizobium sp. WYJ-E13]QWW72506.1 thermonuclease family protein [Rhizobium sp. WYJ-E13]
MNPGARRLTRLLFCTIACTVNALALAGEDDAASRIVSYYQKAYAEGRDLIPAPDIILDTSSIAERLDLQTVMPGGALIGSAFLASDGTTVKLVGAQGCLSVEQVEFAGMRTTCAMLSLAGLTSTLDEAKAAAGNAFPCHFLGQNTGTPTVRFAECFFVKDGHAQSLSEVLIAKGLAFAARDHSGRAIFPEYAQAEESAKRTRTGIWANAHFTHPYGERYRANPSMN